MKFWFESSPLDDDGTLLKVLTLFALVILLLVFLFGPGPRTVVKASQVLPAPGVVFSPPASPLPKLAAQSKTLYLTDRPSFPPLAAATPQPIPTPAGGGILRKIAFTSNRADGRHYQLFMMDADGKNLERLMSSDAFDRDPHFSYDGTRLAFSSNRTGTYQIYTLDLKTRAVRQITWGRDDKTNPFWSPNDRQMLFTLQRDGSSELGLLSPDGTQIWQLTNTFGHSHGYGFSPDGQQISFESTRNNRSEIFILNLKDRKVTTLVETDDLTYRGDPVFSPVGNKLVFSSNTLDQLTRQLYVYDLDWQKHYRVTDDEMDKDDPIFSPDGSKIAYVARWENAWNIFIMDADGKHVRNVTRSYYDNVVPSWR